ncbi:MAG: anti-sigma factor family protein [bacterium]
MKSKMQCDENIRANLVERYVLGGMRKKEKLAFEAHLESCEACSKQLQESQKIVNRLKHAAQSAGWTEGQVAQIDRLYLRGSLLQNINWRLAMKIAIILIAVVIIPFLWWANKIETKLALMVFFERETALLVNETDQTGYLQSALTLHQQGKDREVIANLTTSFSQFELPAEKATAERFLGLSYLFIDAPDSALIHLHNAQIDCGPDAEQLSFLYIANAHLLMGNKLGAMSALKNAAKIHSRFRDKALELKERLDKL